MTYYVDIDNTICSTEGNDYENAVPIQENIDKINKLFDEGNVVVYWTARGNTSGKDWLPFTLKQIMRWGCKLDTLLLNKPSFDIIIDDRALKIEEL